MNIVYDLREKQQFVSFDAESEVKGRLILSAVRRLSSYNIMPLLMRHGLDKVEPEVWYPFQTWLNILNDISANGSTVFDYISLGIAVAELIPFPPEFSRMAFGNVLKAAAHLYELDHRGGNFGKLTAVDAALHEVQFDTCTPYPDDYLYGMIIGIARNYVPYGMHFIVKYDEDILRRDKGGERTCISVFWNKVAEG